MRARIDGGEEAAPARNRAARLHHGPGPRPDANAIAELFTDGFRRDLLAFIPSASVEPRDDADAGTSDDDPAPPAFRLLEAHEADGEGEGPIEIELFGRAFRVSGRDGLGPARLERRLVAALGSVLNQRHRAVFHAAAGHSRLDLFRGNAEDHYVAAFVEPAAYDGPLDGPPSRIATTIHTLRTAALSTYENRRVSTGALLMGPGGIPAPPPADALPYGVELTALKSVHRLCDGKRTLFQVDPSGQLTGIVDVARFAAELDGPDGPDVPCARAYQPHARATRAGGHVCLVLSPNQEIKLFASGVQAFAFTHGRWRILDAARKFGVWRRAVAGPALARTLFQAALNLAEARQGALFFVVRDPSRAVGPVIAPLDLLDVEPEAPAPPAGLLARDPLAKRALHYLARGRSASELDPPVLEALASLDGALATAADGRLLTFGAILRHDAADLHALATAEGARTTAALAASRYGPVLKVSEDGLVSCFLDGARSWDL